MAQKPIAMEQLKQVLQLKTDGIGIREIARRVGISRNSVRKYLSILDAGEVQSDKDLAHRAYSNDLLELDAERLDKLKSHFTTVEAELKRTGVTR